MSKWFIVLGRGDGDRVDRRTYKGAKNDTVFDIVLRACGDFGMANIYLVREMTEDEKWERSEVKRRRFVNAIASEECE